MAPNSLGAMLPSPSNRLGTRPTVALLAFRRVQLVYPCPVGAIRVLSCPTGRERVGDRNGSVLLGARKAWLQPNPSHPVAYRSPHQSRTVKVQGNQLVYIPYCCVHTQVSCFLAAARESPKDARSTGGSKPRGEEQGSVLMQFVEKEQEPKALTVGAKVVQAGKDVSYIVVILGGFAIAGFLLWSIGSEFFSSTSPQTIFAKALKRVKSDPRVVEVLGEPIAGHGDTSGRGRRRNIAHQEYIVDEVTYMRMKFYVDGSKRKGVAFLDLKKNERGKYECRFLFVELQGHSKATIVVEDNR